MIWILEKGSHNNGKIYGFDSRAVCIEKNRIPLWQEKDVVCDRHCELEFEKEAVMGLKLAAVVWGMCVGLLCELMFGLIETVKKSLQAQGGMRMNEPQGTGLHTERERCWNELRKLRTFVWNQQSAELNMKKCGKEND